MQKNKDNSGKTSLFQKISYIMTIVLALLVVALSVLGLLGVFKIQDTNYVTLPMLGFISFVNGMNLYKNNKNIGRFAIGCAIFVFICFAVISCLRFVF